MTAVTTLFQSTIGKKVQMASTGLVLVAWLFLHMAGNLLVFAGQDEFNRYAEFIQSGFGIEPALLWAMRLVLLASLVAHVQAAAVLRRRNVAARPVAYAGGRRDRATTPAAKAMMWGGLAILLFLAFHLAHLTLGVFSEDAVQHAAFVKADAYRNLVVGLGNPIVGLVYVVANLALGAHLFHGVESAFHTLGVSDPRWEPLKAGLGRWVPALIAGGNVLVALACIAGVVAPPDLSWTPPAHP